MKRRAVIASVISLIVLMISSCGTNKSLNDSENNFPEVVNIGVQTLVTPELIARYEGVYEEYLGCPVNLLQFDSGADVNRAFASGSIDIGTIGSSPAAIGISNNLGYEVFWFHDVIGGAESLVVKQDSGMTTVKDLVNKRVATPFASTAHFSLQNALSLNNVDVSTVELYDMQPDDIYAAWIRGDIDAAYVWDPVLSKLIANDGVVITDSAELAEQGIVTADLAVINREFAQKYPDVAVGYIKAQIHAVEIFNDNRNDAINTISEAIDISKEDAENQTKGFIYPSGQEQLTQAFFGSDGTNGQVGYVLKQAADFLVEQGSIDTAADLATFEQFCTGEYIERAINDK